MRRLPLNLGEDELEKSRKKLAATKKSTDGAREYAESIINAIHEPLIVLDQDLTVISASRSFYKFFNVKPEETVGHLIYELGNKQWDIPKLRELLETILPEKTTFDRYEVEHNFDTIGRRTMLLNARQVERALGKERIILLAIEDITEIKTLERKRANLVSMFAHDMKSPLVGIQGFALRLLKKGQISEPDKQRQYLEMIRREAAQLEKAVNDFLDFSRLETGNLKLNFSAVDLDKEFLELVETFQPRFNEAGIGLNLISAEKLPVVQADACNLRRACTNLLDNALKYSSEGSQVTIEAEAGEDSVILRFIDQGVGIAPDELPYIFDMFYRAASHGKKPGYGLGLAGVEAIVKGHGGQVTVSSEVGKGSVFSVLLPLNHNRTGRPTP